MAKRFMSIEDMETYLKPFVETGDKLKVLDGEKLRGEPIDRLVHNAVFHESAEQRGVTRALIKEIAAQLGAVPASIQGLYDAMGRGDVGGFTVPAVNIRGMTYDVARALFRAAIKNSSASFLIEIAKSEIGYTAQQPAEYTSVVLAAAIKEGYKGPVFIQGDHYQMKAESYFADPEKEVGTVKELIKKSISAGFYNIDIDSSTLVKMDDPDVNVQQKHNYEQCAKLTKYIRELEPEGITVSIGGEIGEVGGHNSTVEELVAYMDNYQKLLPDGMRGISKISVQTGTSHGGVPMPDGTVAEVNLDFGTLKKLSATAREKYSLSGAVQHGASTLPDEAFHHFLDTSASEIHLATGFQNMIYDRIPSELKNSIYDWLKKECAGEKKEGQTDEQFFYKTRKKGFGPFKKEFWSLPDNVRNGIVEALEEKFDFLFKKLGAVNTRETVLKYVHPVVVSSSATMEIEAAAL